MVKLIAFADEVLPCFEEQLKFLVRENIKYIELRSLNKKNVLDLDANDIETAKKMLLDYGIKVSAIGSPIGKVCITIVRILKLSLELLIQALLFLDGKEARKAVKLILDIYSSNENQR